MLNFTFSRRKTAIKNILLCQSKHTKCDLDSVAYWVKAFLMLFAVSNLLSLIVGDFLVVVLTNLNSTWISNIWQREFNCSQTNLLTTNREKNHTDFKLCKNCWLQFCLVTALQLLSKPPKLSLSSCCAAAGSSCKLGIIFKYQLPQILSSRTDTTHWIAI